MKTRPIIALAAVAIGVVACGGATQSAPKPTTATTTTTVPPATLSSVVSAIKDAYTVCSTMSVPDGDLANSATAVVYLGVDGCSNQSGLFTVESFADPNGAFAAAAYFAGLNYQDIWITGSIIAYAVQGTGTDNPNTLAFDGAMARVGGKQYSGSTTAPPTTTTAPATTDTTTGPSVFTLKVTGTGGVASVIAVGIQGQQNVHSQVPLPYVQTGPPGEIVTLEAQTADGSSDASISCEIDEPSLGPGLPAPPPVTNSSTGPYSVVTCQSEG